MKQKLIKTSKIVIGLLVFAWIFTWTTNGIYQAKKELHSDLITECKTPVDSLVYECIGNISKEHSHVKIDSLYTGFDTVLDSCQTGSYKPYYAWMHKQKINQKLKNNIKDSIKFYIHDRNEKLDLIDEYEYEINNMENRFPLNLICKK